MNAPNPQKRNCTDIATRKSARSYDEVPPPPLVRSSTTPINAIVSRLAEKPPTLTNPFARPEASFGMKVRARSKPTIDAGPPVAIRQTRTTSIHIGAGVDRARTTAQPHAITPTITRTNHER